MPTVRSIERDMARDNNRFSALVMGIVKSAPFQMTKAPEALTSSLNAAGLRIFKERSVRMFITKKHLSRRAVLRGAGISLALPLLDSMVPAQTPLRKTAAASKTRFCGIEMVHGAATDSTVDGQSKYYWSPMKEGSDFETTLSLASLEPYHDYLTIVTDTDLNNAMSLTPREDGADHTRSSAVFLTGAHPKMTEGADIFNGPSVDQIYAEKFGQDTPLPSLQLCIEDVGSLSGACGFGYSCVYANTISWASPTEPLPMEMDPRVAFERLFGAGGTQTERKARREEDKKHSGYDSQGGEPSAGGSGAGRQGSARRLSYRCARNRAAYTEGGEVQRR